MAWNGRGERTATIAHSTDARTQATITSVAHLAPDVRRYTLEADDGRGLPGFEPGSSLPVALKMAGKHVMKPFPIASSPADAAAGRYEVVVKRGVGGHATALALDSWHRGARMALGRPVTNGAFRHLDGCRQAIAVAGGMGIVPLHSLAKALAQGDADLRLTLFTAADTADELLFRDEWPELAALSNGKLAVVPVIRRGHAEGCENGTITLEMIERHADPSDAAFVLCGPGSTVAALRKELAPLKLPRSRLRFTFSGDNGFNHRPGCDTVHELAVRMGGETHRVPAREDETIHDAIERAGLEPAAYCRGGICGFCEAMLLSGMFVLATDEKGMRAMRERNSLIHPCCSYPRSDMELVVQRTRQPLAPSRAY